MSKYKVKCTNCGKEYLSDAARNGLCPECRKTIRGKKHTEYRDNTYDRITLYVPKGEREQLKKLVSDHDMSLNEFIHTAIDKYTSEVLRNDKLEMAEISGIFSRMTADKKERWNYYAADEMYNVISSDSESKTYIRSAVFLYDTIKDMILSEKE